MCDAEKTAIRALIEKATTSTANEVDPRLLKSIKLAARSSDAEIRAAVDSLMSQLKKPHSHVRYLSLLIVDELFTRSKIFRSLLVPQLDLFLALTVGFRRNLPLPPPSSVASLLRSKSIETLEKWNASFGPHYRHLRLGFDYLKNTLRFQFPNRLETAARLQRERQEREARSRQILLEKFKTLKANYSASKAEVQSTIDEIGECLEIIRSEREFKVTDDDGGEGEEELRSLSLLEIRMDSLREGEKVRENSENKAVFDALRELYKLLVSKHLVLVQDSISILVRVDVSGDRFRDAALKELIDVRNAIISMKKRCTELGCVLDDNGLGSKEEEDDLWEEGKIEVYFTADNGDKVSVDTPSSSKGKTVISSPSPAAAAQAKECSSSTSPRSRLLAEAPVVTWGPIMDDWGSSRDALANQRGLELDGHWGRVDPDAVIPAEKIAELKLHCTVYKEEKAEIRPCLAPLKSGSLCQRRDLRVCPFHGPIVPRDAEGNPLDQDEQTRGETERGNPLDQDKQTQGETEREIFTQATDALLDSDDVESYAEVGKEGVENLAKRAVKNVREREREVKALKRAKLAKVREHNETVLRDAAVASTSYSENFGGMADGSNQGRSDVKVKKVTLASMLKKKVTAKDRLAKRLLNTRVRDASSRLATQGEDSKYREAFPNQW